MSAPGPELGRLNADTSWWFSLGGARVVVDPWLVGSEVDGARWFSEQWHREPVVAPADVPDHDVVVVSQPFSDHCHPETLRQLRPGADLVVVPSARGKVARAVPGRRIHVLPAWDQPPLELAGLRWWRVTPPWWVVPAYHAVVVADPAGRAVLHAPHGLSVAAAEAVAARVDVVALAITRTWYRLPWWLGGVAQPGAAAALAVARAVRAEVAFGVHDEQKVGRGLVRRVEQVRWPDAADEGVWAEVGRS